MALFFLSYYLAYQMIGSLKDYKKDTGRPLNIYEAALFQWVNPKAWTIANERWLIISHFMNTAQ